MVLPLQTSPLSHDPSAFPQFTGCPQLLLTTPHLLPLQVVAADSGVQHALLLQTCVAEQHEVPQSAVAHAHDVPTQVSLVIAHVAPQVVELWQLFITLVLQLLPHAVAVDSAVQHVLLVGSHCCVPHEFEQSIVPPHPLGTAFEQLPPQSVAGFFCLQQVLGVAVLQFGFAPEQQTVPQTVPPAAHVQAFPLHVYPVFVQFPQAAVRPLPGFVIVPQLPLGAPASRQTGGPSHVPLSVMQAYPPAQPHVIPASSQPSGNPERQTLG